MVYMVPVLLFVVFYGNVIYSFQQRTKADDLTASRVISKASIELTKTAIIVTVIYTLCMTPGYWNYLLGNTGVITFDLKGTMHRIGVWLASVNSSANPFVYALLLPAYRRSIAKTFYCPN